MKRKNKKVIRQKNKPQSSFSNLLTKLGDAFCKSDLAIKVNGHEFKKDKKNNMTVSFTKDKIKTSIHFADSKLGFEQTEENDTQPINN